jgi:hypothetical protein
VLLLRPGAEDAGDFIVTFDIDGQQPTLSVDILPTCVNEGGP